MKTVNNQPLSGTVAAIASKSMAHRLLICAALSDTPGEVVCAATSKDIEATRVCLTAMKEGNPLPCGESGSTLRFLLPVAAALGLEAEFHMEGRLPERPLAPLDEQMQAHGASFSHPRREVLQVRGRLTPGDYVMAGDVSSQFLSGLFFALPLLDAPSTVTLTTGLESAPYVDMTLSALRQFGIHIKQHENVYTIPAGRYQSPGQVVVEGDWSNGAFFLCAGALGKPVTVTGLDPESLQGDKAVFEILSRFGAKTEQQGNSFTVSPGKLRAIDIDAAEIPDLVPVLSVVAAAAEGTTRIYNASRLRLKESDRIASVCAMIGSLGGEIEETADGLLIFGGKRLAGGRVDSFGDHRIAMAAAVAATVCTAPVEILHPQVVEKSYPQFWDDFESCMKGS